MKIYVSLITLFICILTFNSAIVIAASENYFNVNDVNKAEKGQLNTNYKKVTSMKGCRSYLKNNDLFYRKEYKACLRQKEQIKKYIIEQVKEQKEDEKNE
jgi:hypothetical protein